MFRHGECYDSCVGPVIRRKRVIATMRLAGWALVRPFSLRRCFWLVSGGWTLVVVVLSLLFLVGKRHECRQHALGQARAIYQTDKTYRQWIAKAGGVYVEASQGLKPNPYLRIPDRDITLDEGRKLTLLNSAYLLRLIHQSGDSPSQPGVRLVSAAPLNPENTPDAWEQGALIALARGKNEVADFIAGSERTWLRLAKPLYIEKACLRCHSQGYKEGDLRGAVSVTVPVSTVWELAWRDCMLVFGGHVLLWGLGMGGIVLVAGRLKGHLRHREQIAAELDRARRAAESASQAKSQFLAQMSHEIRTPLTAILGYAELLLTSRDRPAEERCGLETIHRNGQILLRLINDLLSLSRIEAGRLVLEPAECALWPIVHQAVELVRARAAEKKLSLGIQPVFPLPQRIRTDPVRLRQILVNLVGNAVKFTEQGEVALRVQWQRDAQGRPMLHIAVRDTGIGMTAEQLGRLFCPFGPPAPGSAQRFGGTGLGLAISKRLAQLLGGDIAVESQPGRGSVFTVCIPAEPVGDVWMHSLDESPEPKVTASEKDEAHFCGRVLVAEDGLDNQRLIRALLERDGLEVHVAENGRAACRMVWQAAAEGRPYDLVLMDMQMPEMDGYEATRQLREEGWIGPVVALTAEAMDGDRARCLQAGCDDYLSKPIERSAFRAALARWLPAQTAACPRP